MKRKLLFLLFLANLSIYAQYTTIPDVKFETKLIALGIDKDGQNGKVLTSSINTVTDLDVAMSDITDLTGIQDFIALGTLGCSLNLLTSLDVSKNTNLAAIDCRANELTTLDVSNLPFLNGLICSENRLSSLDVSKNPILSGLYCSKNQLISLNIKNGNNTNFQDVFTDFSSNPDLICIQVDNATYSNTNWGTYKDDTASYAESCTQAALYTFIPDVNFEIKLIALGIDSGIADGKVLTSSVANLTVLEIPFSSISNLTGIAAFSGLKTLNCYSNQLTGLDLSKNTALENLNCSANLLRTVDVSKNVALKVFECNQNQLTSLDVTQNTALTRLYCYENQLTGIDITKNIILNELYCAKNQLSSLDVTKNQALLSLYCANNVLTALDTSQNPALALLHCPDNLLSQLDISKNAAVTLFQCQNNKLLDLNVKNAKNTFLNSSLNFTGNPNLTCIQVDNAAYSNTNWTDKKDPTASYLEACAAANAYTLIPDNYFEEKLIMLGIDKEGLLNGKVLTSSLQTITALNLLDSNIADLTGIEDFAALKTLNCASNKLTRLDFSKNSLLTSLTCWANPLTSLNVTNNPALIVLYASGDLLTSLNVSNNVLLEKLLCGNGPLAALDISKNKALIELNCSQSQISSLNLSQNSSLQSLACYSNQLTHLDVSANAALTFLSCFNNRIAQLDVTKNTGLTEFICDNNQLASLDVSKNPALLKLYSRYNQLSALDISKNPLLRSLKCNDNQLEYLNLKNGNNINFITADLSLNNNPKLSCIAVDNTVFSNTNWSAAKDASATYAQTCTPPVLYTLIPDTHFEQKLIALGIDSEGLLNGKVLTSNVQTVTTLDCSDSTISDLTGIQDFVALQHLYCYTNPLTQLDLSKNVALESLICFDDELLQLDVSNNPLLTLLDCESNQLTALDVTKNLQLKYLYCGTGWISSVHTLSSLDVSKNSLLIDLSVSFHQIAALDITNNTALEYLDCMSNLLTDLDVSRNEKLTFLRCAQNKLSSLDSTKNIALDYLNSSNNLLTHLTLSTNLQLSEVSCYGNRLNTLDTSRNTVLTKLECSNNVLTSLDISSNVLLTELECFSNLLPRLDISKNTNLTKLNCRDNLLSAIDPSQNILLNQLNCSSNELTSISISENTNLSGLICDHNKLIHLNLKNGKNEILFNFDFTNNPDLTCIQVDNMSLIDDSWLYYKDPTASYSENCPPASISVSSEFEDKLIALGIDTNGKNGIVALAAVTNVTSIDLSHSGITDLSGIEYFTALEKLICKQNLISTIDLSKNTALTFLDCSGNPLTALNVSKNILLAELYCDGAVAVTTKATATKGSSSQLTALDLSNNPLLTQLNCANNQLLSLDLSKNTLLTAINCSNNKLYNLNLNNGNNTNMLTVNFKSNASLPCIKVDDAAYSDANWAGAKDPAAIYSKTACTLGLVNSVFSKITVYPNPAKEQLHIDNIVLENITIYDAEGKLVKTTNSAFTAGSSDHTISFAGLPTGIYYVYLQSQGVTTTRKIAVE